MTFAWRPVYRETYHMDKTYYTCVFRSGQDDHMFLVGANEHYCGTQHRSEAAANAHTKALNSGTIKLGIRRENGDRDELYLCPECLDSILDYAQITKATPAPGCGCDRCGSIEEISHA